MTEETGLTTPQTTDIAKPETEELAPKSAAAQLGRPSKPKLPVPGQGPAKKPFNKLAIVLVLVAACLFLGTLILFAVRGRPSTNVSNDPRLMPTPTLVPLPTIQEPEIGKPSQYAEDPEILQLESAIKSFSAQMDTVNLTESELDPPRLETAIHFNGLE